MLYVINTEIQRSPACVDSVNHCKSFPYLIRIEMHPLISNQ